MLSYLLERNFLRGLSLVVFILGWHLISKGMDPILIPTPFAVFSQFAFFLRGNELMMATVQSLSVLVLGLGLGCVLGIPLGILTGRYLPLYHFSEIGVITLYAVPISALLPLLMVWFGLGFKTKVAFVFLAVSFPLIFNAQAGVRNLDASHVDVFRIFGATERETMAKLATPASLPFIGTGLRVAIGRAVTLTVVVEMLTSISGLGGLILRYGNFLETAKMFVPLLVLAVVALIIYFVAARAEKKLSMWRE